MQITQLKSTHLGDSGLSITSVGFGAIAWTLRNPAIDGATVGFRSPEQVDPVIEAANLQLSEDDITTIEGAQ